MACKKNRLTDSIPLQIFYQKSPGKSVKTGNLSLISRHYISKAARSKQMQQMWKFVGIIVFSIAFGMVLTLLISNRLAGLIVAVILLLVSYNMIFCEK